MEARYLNGGSCRQLVALVDRRTWWLAKVHAVFVVLRHPREGWILIDTGYGGPAFNDATRGWPYWVYRLTVPTSPGIRTRDILKNAGIDPAEIRHVVVTHFHVDHIGGLAEFPDAKIYYHEHALAPLQALPPKKQAHAAFFPKQVPDWLERQSHVLSANEFQSSVARASSPSPFPSPISFETLDLFDDSLIHLVHLPGHAPGHLGVSFKNEGGRRVLYAVDAYWETAQVEQSVDPLSFALNFEWNPEEYKATIAQLRALATTGQWQLVSCHARKTQSLIE